MFEKTKTAALAAAISGIALGGSNAEAGVWIKDISGAGVAPTQQIQSTAIAGPSFQILGAYDHFEARGIKLTENQELVRDELAGRVQNYATIDGAISSRYETASRTVGALDARQGKWTPEKLEVVGGRILELDDQMRHLAESVMGAMEGDEIPAFQSSSTAFALMGKSVVQDENPVDAMDIIQMSGASPDVADQLQATYQNMTIISGELQSLSHANYPSLSQEVEPRFEPIYAVQASLGKRDPDRAR